MTVMALFKLVELALVQARYKRINIKVLQNVLHVN